MFSVGKNGAPAAGTGQPGISANHQRLDPNAGPGPHAAPTEDMGASRPPRLQNLAALLRRENVEFVLVIGGVRALRVSTELADGSTDMKAIAVGDVGGTDAGCFVLLRLADNPLNVGPASSNCG